jgi:hypothetical protein
MLSSPASDPDQDFDQESDFPPAQLELEKEEEWGETPTSEEEVAYFPQVGSWAEEPSSLCPQPAKEPLEQQVATLTKKLTEAKDAAIKAAHKARQQLSQAETESRENKRALSLSRRHCVSKIRELITEDEPQTWTKNT